MLDEETNSWWLEKSLKYLSVKVFGGRRLFVLFFSSGSSPHACETELAADTLTLISPITQNGISDNASHVVLVLERRAFGSLSGIRLVTVYLDSLFSSFFFSSV